VCNEFNQDDYRSGDSAGTFGSPLVVLSVRHGKLEMFRSAMAPVRLEVFSDFQCPACRQLYIDTLRKVISDCVSTNKVYLADHDFPLQMHPYARQAARWANAAARVHKYEQASDALFEKQAQWSQNGNIEPVIAAILTPAELVRVKNLLKDPSIDKAIDDDLALGQKQQAKGTPTMFLQRHQNRYPIAAGVSYPMLRRLIDDQAAR
jgi:protein-disulfide isomerase